MIPAKDEYCHCPHCGRETRHSIARERVLAPVLWCLTCYSTHLGEPEIDARRQRKGSKPADAGQVFRLAG